MKKVKPKVDKMTNQMQQNIESVSEKISKEIFDDEIYERANFDASYNEEDHTESGIDATGKRSLSVRGALGGPWVGQAADWIKAIFRFVAR